ncbi:MAG TPA: S46 family peptidase [Thermoanaerobaculia bacterium]
MSVPLFRPILRTLLCGIALVLAATVAVADDGLWMPQQIPQLGDELRKRGLQLDPKQFADLTGFPMGAVVHLGGCSASFVSPQGLIATNHHCVYGALQFNATPQNDLVKNGFLARTMADEVQALPDARVYVTSRIDDVTSQILANMPANDEERARTITRRRREMVNECEKAGGTRCLVASYFDGAQYLRITQMEIRDVRLVYAPPLGVGNFGDEIDNWMWPRHTGDFGFYRAYVGKDGKPADFSKENVPYQPKHHLKISTRDLDPGDLVFVAGYPGVTERHAVAAEVENDEQYDLPTSIRYRTMLNDVLQERGKESRDIALKNASRIAGLENYLKKHTGMLESFRNIGVLEAKRKEEAAIRTAIAADAKLSREYEAAYGELTKILSEQRRTRERDTVFGWLYTASPMLSQASTLYRLSVEKTKADLDRADDYTERNRKRLAASTTRTRRSMEPGSDRAGLRLFLLEAAKLPAGQRIAPVDAALAATGANGTEAQVDALLDKLYASTKIGDADAEKAMFEETTAQLMARKDSMIEFAAALRTFGAEHDRRNLATSGAMSRIRPVILNALRVARGGRLYPDANSTLRVAFGTVEGYSPRDAVRFAPQTDVRGILQKDTGVEPFNSPAKLLERARGGQFGPYADPELGSMPVAFISTTTVTNGSSGSATLNAWGELNGLAFDMNWEGVGADYVVDQDVTRTIHVDSRYMLWVMDAVDGAHNVLREMGVKPVFE